MMAKQFIVLSFLVFSIIVQTVYSAKVQKANFQLIISQENHQNIEHKVNLNSKIPQTLQLTQSSRLKIHSKIAFSQKQFTPQYVTFRLKHSQFSNLTQPVVARFNSQLQQYVAFIDLGDPKHIQPFSSQYQLEVLIADQSLDNNIRNVIANCEVKFRKSLTQLPRSDLHYKLEGLISTSAPAQRQNPSNWFTLFVTILVVAVDGVFLYGLNYLKVNISQFPKTSSGFLINVGFVVILMLNLGILLKFWLNSTFLDTLQHVLILILPTALIANYAMVHIKKN